MLHFGLLVCVCLGLVCGRVVNRPSRPRQADDPVAAQFNRTRIAIEVIDGRFINAFVKGGFTNGDPSLCTGTADENDPCSIPIRHVANENSTDAYNDWSSGDRYLDLYGPEAGQGSHDNTEALGTPLTEFKGEDILVTRLNSRHRSPKRMQSYFYYVELDMNCSQTDGIFELEIVAQESQTQGNQRDARPRDSIPERSPGKPFRINFPKNFDFDQFDAKVEASRLARRMPDGRFNITNPFGHPSQHEGERRASDDNRKPLKPPRALGWKPYMDSASGPDARPFELIPQRVQDSTRGLRFPGLPDAQAKNCFGVPFTASYVPENHRFLGKCGFANVFTYTKTYCEVNPIPSSDSK